MKVDELIRKYGKPYSKELGINLRKDAFKWFIASILFGARISEEIAMRTYREFEKEGVLSPDKLCKTSWNKLVKMLDAGGYARYDFKTADKLILICKKLKEKGGLPGLKKSAKTSRELEKKLMEFKGIGKVTANIFLRELRVLWKNADPEPLPHIIETAKKLKIKLPRNRKTLKFIKLECALHRYWRENK